MSVQLQTAQRKVKRPTPKATRPSNGRHVGDIVIGGEARIPGWVRDLATFRRWCCSDDYPSRGDFSHLDGELWVDLSMERMSHNQLKTIIAIIVGGLILERGLGRYCTDRMRLVHVDAGLSCEPDGMFLSSKSLRTGQVTLAEGEDTLEITGTPDMVLEVISQSSVEKDTVVLRDLYARAGIPEYWLVDSLKESPTLEIFKLSNDKYTAARRQDDWVKSHVFGRSLRLVRRQVPAEELPFLLETR